MPPRISENVLSRRFELGRQAGRELIYDVLDGDDETEVEELVLTEAPAVYNELILEGVSVEPQGGGVWKAYARYVQRENDDEYTFDTTGGAQNLKQSLFTVGRFGRSGETPPNFHGAINVSEDRVEGVDIVTRKFEWTETHRFDDDFVTDDYKRILFLLTGTVNAGLFRNFFAAGECLFMGAFGGKRGDEKWAITYRFSGEPNVRDLSIGSGEGYYGYYGDADITGVDKDGWDYLWIRHDVFADDAAKALVRRPTSAHVERVYYRADFGYLGIGA